MAMWLSALKATEVQSEIWKEEVHLGVGSVNTGSGPILSICAANKVSILFSVCTADVQTQHNCWVYDIWVFSYLNHNTGKTEDSAAETREHNRPFAQQTFLLFVRGAINKIN